MKSVCWYIYKGVIRSRNLKDQRQYNGQNKIDKRTNNDLQNTTQKTKDRVTQTPLKIGSDHRYSRRIDSSCFSISDLFMNLALMKTKFV